MNFKNPAFQLIAVSIIAALAILVAAAAFEGAAQTLTFIIIAIWWIPFSILTTRRAKNAQDENGK